jgi:predicted nuclease of predicted toxin-antitoxin system
MKLLLDENLPKRLEEDFTNNEIYSIRDKRWNGAKNGELLKLMIAEEFNALLTFDKNIRYHQNFNKYTVSVFVYMLMQIHTKLYFSYLTKF